MKRRELMIGSGTVAIAALAGRALPARAAESDDDRDVTTFELLPATSAIDTDYHQLGHWDVTDAEEPDDLGFETAVVGEIDDLDVEDVETVATVRAADEPRLFGAAAGSFDRPEHGELHREIDPEDGNGGDWQLRDGDEIAIAGHDERLAFAAEGPADDRLEAVETAIDVAIDEADGILEELSLLEPALDRFPDRAVLYVIPDAEAGMLRASLEELVDSFGAAFEEHPADMHGTVENDYFFEEADDADLDEEDVEALIDELERGTIESLEVDHEDDLVFASATIEAPPERDREAAPDARVRADTDPDEGTAVLEHVDGEPIPADELELWVNGELADTQPDDEFEEFAVDDSFAIDTGPLATVYLRWIDEDEDRYYDYVSAVVGENAFETDYDVSAETVELTYTADATADPDRLELAHRVRDDDEPRLEVEHLEEPIDALGESLESGDSIVVEGVEMGDSVRLDLDVGGGPDGLGPRRTTLVAFRPRKPRLYVRREPEADPIAVYRDDESREAAAFRVLYDGDDSVTQFEEDGDTLEPGDQLALDPAEFGTEITIEWTEPDEPVVVTEHVVEPRVRVDDTYDDEAGEVVLEHVHGEEVAAENLELRVDGDAADTRPADQHDVFGDGDEIVAPVDPFAFVELVWAGTEDVEATIGRHATGADLFEVTYDEDDATVGLVYTGEREADPERLAIERFSPGHVSDEDADRLFVEEYDRLSAGDGLTLENVEHDERITVSLDHEDDDRHHRRHLFSFTPEPRFAFGFEDRDGELVAIYRDEIDRDAGEFRVLVDGEDADVEIADEHDTLEADDEVVLGSYETGTEITIEWTVPDEPTEVDSHLVAPDAEFEIDYDDGTLTIEHDGGDELSAEDVEVYYHPTDDGPVTWGDEGTVSEGDDTTIEADERPEIVHVVYRGRELLDERTFD